MRSLETVSIMYTRGEACWLVKAASREGRGAYTPDTAPAELQVAPKIATAVIWALQMQGVAFHQPCHLQLDAGVDEVEELAGRMLQGEGIRVGELLTDGEVQLRR